MRDEYDFKNARRGSVVPAQSGKTRITIRIDDDLIDWFRHQADQDGGGQYQRLINDALRHYISEHERPIEEVIRLLSERSWIGRQGRRAGLPICGKVNGKKKTVSPLIKSDNLGYNQKASRRVKVKGKDDEVGSTEETLFDCC